MDYTQSEESLRSASEAIHQNVQKAVNNPAGHVMHDLNDMNERNYATEPLNTTMRSILLGGAGLAIATSMIMQVTGRKHESLFLGQWVPTLVSVALWYQIIKGQRHAFH